MPSLTPSHRSDEATGAATRDGIISGFLTLIPSTAAVYAAMKTSPKFVKVTNWQSRTALAIMPPFFMYALSAEKKLTHKMEEMATQTEHSKKVNEWAQNSNIGNSAANVKGSTNVGGTTERQLLALYRQSVEESGVRIIPGDKLGIHHQSANFFQENPFKILAGLGIPTVLYIFHGRSDQKHLQLQSKLMHTRVFGQFAVISLLLSLMGFKTYMDSTGKFITQAEADQRVEEMRQMREELLKRIEHEKHLKEKRDAMLRKKHDL